MTTIKKAVENNKVCTGCKLEKAITEYYNATRYHCIDCERTSARLRMARPENRIRGAFRRARNTARKYEAIDDLTHDDVEYMFKISDYRCSYCGIKTNDIELDHIIPLSKNGANTIANITTACNSCNKTKHNRPLLPFIFLRVGEDMEQSDAILIISLIERMAYRQNVSHVDIIEQLKDQYFNDN